MHKSVHHFLQAHHSETVGALGPVPWPRGFKTHPEMDRQRGGTLAVVFAADLKELGILFERFCNREREFAPHATFGRMPKAERMRYTYIQFDHHLRQFGA